MSDTFIEVVQSLNLKMGKCYPNHDPDAPECGICLIEGKCEVETKRIIEMQKKEDVAEVDESAGPMEYLIGILRGKRGYKTTVEDGDKTTIHYFRKGGVSVLMVAVSKSSGRIQMKSKKGQKVMDALKSREQVDELMSALLP